MSFFFSNWPYF